MKRDETMVDVHPVLLSSNGPSASLDDISISACELILCISRFNARAVSKQLHSISKQLHSIAVTLAAASDMREAELVTATTVLRKRLADPRMTSFRKLLGLCR